MYSFTGSQFQPTLYKCIAPNYFKEVYDDTGTNLDYLKEVCCSNLKNVYTKKQIERMSDFGLDLWKGLIWIDHIKLQHNFKITTLNEKYRLLKITTEIEKIKAEITGRIKKMVNNRSFYSTEEIKQLGKRLGIDLWANALWQKFKEKKLIKNGEGKDVVFYEAEG